MRSDVVPSDRPRMWRSRWAAIGAAVAVTLGTGGLVAVQAASSPPSSVVMINPVVRVLDTRPESNVGLAGPFQRGTSRTLQVTGTIPTGTGSLTVVPGGATGVLLNVTVQCLNRPGVVCQGGYLAVRPGDATGQTQTSSLNFASGDIVPNSVQVGLPAAGNIDIVYGPYVAGAQVDVIADIVGYTVAGAAATGPRGYSAWDVIPSGITVTGELSWDGHQPTNTGLDSLTVNLSGIAPVPLTHAEVNFATSGADADPTCSGSATNPTAPAGKVCIYLWSLSGIDLGFTAGYAGALSTRAFRVMWRASGNDNGEELLRATWAYTAP